MKTLLLAVLLQCPDGSPPPCGRPAPANQHSVAVLYFSNASRDTSDNYLADGLTEEIILRLQQVRRLEVKSRFESQRVRARRAGVSSASLGRELNARFLVNGSIQRAGDRVVVRVELTRADRGVGVWSERFDRTSANVLDVIDDVARGVATGVAGQLLPAEVASLARRPTNDPVAYEHFIRGNLLLAQRDPFAIERAVEQYRLAAGRDPSFRAAIARVAYAYGIGVAHGVGTRPLEQTAAMADSATREAVRRAPDIGETWMARGFLLLMQTLFTDMDSLDTAVALLARAVEMDPGNAEAHHQYAQGLIIVERGDDARAEYLRALQLEPGRAVTFQELAELELGDGRIEAAKRWADSAIAADPRSFRAYQNRSNAFIALGDLAAAQRDAAAAEAIGRNQPSRQAELAGHRIIMMIAQGDSAGARRALDSLPQDFRLDGLIALGETSLALDIIERIPQRGLRCAALGTRGAKLRTDERYARIFAMCRRR